MQEYENLLNTLFQNLKYEFEPTAYEVEKHRYHLMETLAGILGESTDNGDALSDGLENVSEAFESLLKEYHNYYNEWYNAKHHIEINRKELSRKLWSIIQNHMKEKQATRRKLYPQANKQLKKLKRDNPITLDILSKMEKTRNENAHSDIIAGLLDANKCPNIYSRFLYYILTASLYHSERNVSSKMRHAFPEFSVANCLFPPVSPAG